MSTNLYALTEARPGHPCFGRPFYVGIGTTKRPHKHLMQSRSKAGHRNLRLHEVLASHSALGIVPGITIIGVFETKTDAGVAEKQEIARLGRIGIEPNGTLCNLASGGQGPDVELMRLPEVRKRNSDAQKRRAPETFLNAIEAAKRLSKDPEINRIRSEASTAANNRSWADPEIRAKRIAAMKGKRKAPSPEALEARRANARKPRSEESLAASRAAADRNWADPEFRAKRSRNQAAAWKDPVKRANMLSGRSAGISASWKDEETKASRISGIKAAAKKRVPNGDHS